MLAPTSLLLLGSTLALTLVSASITHNLAYDSPSFRVRSLGTDRGEVQKRHKRWEYYDGEVKFPYGVASGDPCECARGRGPMVRGPWSGCLFHLPPQYPDAMLSGYDQCWGVALLISPPPTPDYPDTLTPIRSICLAGEVS
jgi:hypothetical protein